MERFLCMLSIGMMINLSLFNCHPHFTIEWGKSKYFSRYNRNRGKSGALLPAGRQMAPLSPISHTLLGRIPRVYLGLYFLYNFIYIVGLKLSVKIIQRLFYSFLGFQAATVQNALIF